MSSTLTVPVQWFVDDVSAALHELAHTTDESDEGPRRDAATEAFNLTCGFIDADGLHTDDELWALITAFGPMLPTQLGQATPEDVRRAGLVTNAKAKLRTVTPMFALLVAADVKNGTRESHAYYRAALEIGFAIAAIDSHTSTTELAVIGDFQRLLLTTITGAGLPRPGEPEHEPQPTLLARRSTAPSASSRRATSSRPTDRSSSRASSARPRSRCARCSTRPTKASCSSTRPMRSPVAVRTTSARRPSTRS